MATNILAGEPGKARGNAVPVIGESPYTDARLIDIGLLEREQRHATSWRRAFFTSVGAGFLLLMLALILSTKDHTEAVVYKEDRSGDIALIGATSSNRTPTDLAVKHQLVTWIQAVRDIPDSDDLVNRNAQTALYMTSSNSPAYTAYRNFIIADNPKSLAARGYRRTVSDVEVNRLADLAYRIAWHERLVSGNADGGAPATFSGTVYLAQIPVVPSDPIVGQFNPAGVFIKDIDMNWSVLRP